MFLFTTETMMNTTEIKEASNKELLDAYAKVSFERRLATDNDIGLHDFDDRPIRERFDSDDKDLLFEYANRLKDELHDRLGDEAKLKRMNLLNDQLSEIQDSLEAFMKSGLNRDIMVYWMHHNCDLNITQVRNVLSAQDRFFNKMFD